MGRTARLISFVFHEPVFLYLFSFVFLFLKNIFHNRYSMLQ